MNRLNKSDYELKGNG